MSKNFHERLEPADIPLPSDRSTGLVLAAVALIVAYFWRASATVLWTALGLALVLGVLSLVRPSLLRPLNVAWMRFAVVLSRIMNPIVMLLLFAIAIVPAGLLMQLKRDPLRVRRAPGATSYWIAIKKDPNSSMSNQF